MPGMCRSYHLEKGCVLTYLVQGPLRVEDLVPAML